MDFESIFLAKSMPTVLPPTKPVPINLDFISINKLDLRSRSGNVVIWLDDKIAATLDITNEKGKILCDFDLKDGEKTKKTLKGVINKPGVSIVITNRSGHIAIKKRSKRPSDA